MSTTSSTSSTSSSTKTNFLTTLGAGSGVDTKSLAENLVEAARAPRKERIDAKITKSEAKITGYSTLKYLLAELKTAFQGLNDAKDFQSLTVANSQSSALTVTAGSTASAGTVNLEVTQLASGQVRRTAALDATLNGGAAFTLNLSVHGGADQPIQVTTATPQGMADAINAADLGVTAQAINTGSGYQVVVTGKEGALNDFILSTDASTPVAGLDFGTSLRSAANAEFSLNGIAIVRSSNTINDVLDGVTFQLRTPTSSAARIDLARDTSGIKAKVQSLVTAYNQFEEGAKALASRAASEDEADTITSALAGDSLLQTVRAQVRGFITGNSSSPGTTVQAMRNVGVSIDREGKMVLDDAKLETALSKNFSEVVKMFSANANDQSVYSVAPGGAAGDAVKGIDKLIRNAGTLATQTENVNAEITRYKDQLTRLEDQMKALLERYTKQFSAMDNLVGQATATRASLKSTFDAWNKSS